MIRFLRCTRAGTNAGDLMFEVETADGQRHQFQMSPDSFTHLFAMGWKAAQGLPPAAQEGEAPTLETTAASFAVVNLQPALALMSGPLVLALALTAEQMAYLQSEYQKFLAGSGRDQTH